MGQPPDLDGLPLIISNGSIGGSLVPAMSPMRGAIVSTAETVEISPNLLTRGASPPGKAHHDQTGRARICRTVAPGRGADHESADA
jgi:hypothetical protein